ncbi:hypothetical protein EVAR_95042_1 [Eumeta japonica]|uniref:Uncharacterized protein n=1 Tax=Eumeta variegata TaxID=151549 RepID=A0A4C1VUJ8_EUMVA|nr:hypothetical protein EVAR_95042_1 [Eumeta japonica]
MVVHTVSDSTEVNNLISVTYRYSRYGTGLNRTEALSSEIVIAGFRIDSGASGQMSGRAAPARSIADAVNN